MGNSRDFKMCWHKFSFYFLILFNLFHRCGPKNYTEIRCLIIIIFSIYVFMFMSAIDLKTFAFKFRNICSFSFNTVAVIYCLYVWSNLLMKLCGPGDFIWEWEAKEKNFLVNLEIFIIQLLLFWPIYFFWKCVHLFTF